MGSCESKPRYGSVLRDLHDLSRAEMDGKTKARDKCDFKIETITKNDGERKLNFIETSNELLQVIARIRHVPVLLICCITDKHGVFTNQPDGFHCWNFVKKYKDQFDIYFKSSIDAQGLSIWTINIYDESQKRVYTNDLAEMEAIEKRLKQWYKKPKKDFYRASHSKF